MRWRNTFLHCRNTADPPRVDSGDICNVTCTLRILLYNM